MNKNNKINYYLHEHERAVLGADGLENERNSSNRKWFSIDELHFAIEAVNVKLQYEVSIVSVAFVTINVITYTSPAFSRHTAVSWKHKSTNITSRLSLSLLSLNLSHTNIYLQHHCSKQ